MVGRRKAKRIGGEKGEWETNISKFIIYASKIVER